MHQAAGAFLAARDTQVKVPASSSCVLQEPAPPVDDDDMMLLRCLETFDDEDL